MDIFNDNELGAGWPDIPMLMPGDPVLGGPGGASNAPAQALGQRTNRLRHDINAVTAEVEALIDRVDLLAAADGPALEDALRALMEERWPYRHYEVFSVGWTLIQTPDRQPLPVTILTTPVPGDDSLDASDTTALRAGSGYVVWDGAGRQEVTITEILTATRIRIAPALAIPLAAGAQIAQTDWAVAPRAATAAPGSTYYARSIDLGPATGQRAIVVRSAPTTATLRAWWRPAGGSWVECVWSWRRSGTDYSGRDWQEIEYILPATGQTQVRVTIDPDTPEAPINPVTISRITILEGPTGLGGIGNGPIQPAALSPAAGAVGVGAAPALSLSAYASPTGAAQAGLEMELRQGAVTLLATGLITGASSAYALAPGLLLPASSYAWRGRYHDARGIPSAWSDWTGFSTSTTFSAIQPPTLLSPAAGAIGVPVNPTLSAAPLVVVGGSDTHTGSQWQIASDIGFDAITYDSGEITDLTSHVASASLSALGVYYWRVRYRAATLGWSDWSASRQMTVGFALTFASSTRLTGPAPAGDHNASEWEVRAPDGALIWSSGVTTTALTAVDAPGCPAPATQYQARARYRIGAAWTEWSSWHDFVSGATPLREATFLGPFSGDFVVPATVAAVSGVAIGPGGFGAGSSASGGGGGGLAWFNARVTVPGGAIPIVVGGAGTGTATSLATLVTASAGQSNTLDTANLIAGGDIYGGDGGGRGGSGGVDVTRPVQGWPHTPLAGAAGDWLAAGVSVDAVQGRGLLGLRRYIDGLGIQRVEARDSGSYGRGGFGGSNGQNTTGRGAMRLIWGLGLDNLPRSYPYDAAPLY